MLSVGLKKKKKEKERGSYTCWEIPGNLNMTGFGEKQKTRFVWEIKDYEILGVNEEHIKHWKNSRTKCKNRK